MNVNIFIKSRFKGNPRGTGEAAAVLEFIDSKGKVHTRRQVICLEDETKNALHLKICIAAIRLLLKPCNVTVHIDCDYIKSICELWLDRWQQDGWKKANGKPPANITDWQQLYMLAQIHVISFAVYDGRHDEELERALNEIHGK